MSFILFLFVMEEKRIVLAPTKSSEETSKKITYRDWNERLASLIYMLAEELKFTDPLSHKRLLGRASPVFLEFEEKCEQRDYLSPFLW